MQKSILENTLRITVALIMSITIVLMVIALFDGDTSHEAPIGDFSVSDFNEGWSMTLNGQTRTILLPYSAIADTGDVITLTNTLPENISDNSSLMVRSSMEDITVCIDGQQRTNYASQKDYAVYYIPSAYVVTELSASDAGKEISITVVPKGSSVLNGILIGPGNNVWFEVIKDGLFVNISALIVLIMGIVVCLVLPFMRGAYHIDAPRCLSFLMIDVGLWMLSESTLRQFIFRRPLLSQYFSYLTLEIIGVLVAMYFDEVQHRNHHRRYIFIETISVAIVLVNVLLQITGVMDMYVSMPVSHIWMGVSILICVVNIFSDIRNGTIKEYFITAIGMVIFLVMAIAEIGSFYIRPFSFFGPFICIGLVILMIATVMQALTDEAADAAQRERRQSESSINAIETIAGAIDARDEYTGGHSERVGLYAGRLAREMAADYDLSEEDILRVQYIGLVHDIGKIGVADTVLNKSGRLTDEEFSLMKKHPEIGYEIMSSMGENIEGLLDGIRYHHERFDGKGYPDGLSDTDIPLVARILALADSYDAMTSNRVYRKRLSDEQVRNEIERCAGTQFDPALARIFVRLLDSGKLQASTIDGVASDVGGRVLISGLLESKLQKDLINKEEILNPSHVRMLCYVIKLMEKKGKEYRVLFLGADVAPEEVSAALGPHDMNIMYTPDTRVLALYDRTDSETEEFIRGFSGANIRNLSASR